MGFSAQVILDSVTENGDRLTTMEVTFPRFILPEFNTHRMFSRNSASSRAIPVEKMIKKVLEDTFVPDYWGANQKGMQAQKEITGWQRWLAPKVWVLASRVAVLFSKTLLKLGVHKQLTNRLLEPFMFHTVLVTSSEWSNFFALRCHPDAQPEIRLIAELMRQVYNASTPKLLKPGEWHLPLTPDIDVLKKTHDLEEIKKISSGRCARISFLTHFGTRDTVADVTLCTDLLTKGHMSPLEHVATPAPDSEFYGNFKGWIQMRKQTPGEADFGSRAKIGA